MAFPGRGILESFIVLELGVTVEDINNALVAHDIVYLKPGTHKLGDTAIVIPNNKSLIGLSTEGAEAAPPDGIDRVFLDYDSGKSTSVISMEGNATIKNLYIDAFSIFDIPCIDAQFVNSAVGAWAHIEGITILNWGGANAAIAIRKGCIKTCRIQTAGAGGTVAIHAYSKGIQDNDLNLVVEDCTLLAGTSHRAVILIGNEAAPSAKVSNISIRNSKIILGLGGAGAGSGIGIQQLGGGNAELRNISIVDNVFVGPAPAVPASVAVSGFTNANDNVRISRNYIQDFPSGIVLSPAIGFDRAEVVGNILKNTGPVIAGSGWFISGNRIST